MKQVFTSIVFLLLLQNSFAQKIRFTDSSNSWHEQFGNMSTGGVRKYEILGDTLINGIGYSRTTLSGFLVREDTITSQVFLLDDTTEILLYDFSLSVGDTIHYLKGNHYVEKIDSVEIDSAWYKVFYFKKGSTINGWPYAVIEGVGCIDGLIFPMVNYSVIEAHYRLVCFHNKGNKPVFNTTVPYGNPSSTWQTFDNKDSCYVSVSNIGNDTPKRITISPHPANATSLITFPHKISNGTLFVYNNLGQIITGQTIHNKTQLAVGHLPGAGMYYYRVSDNTNGKMWQGKLMYE